MLGALDTGRTVRSLAYLLSKFERVKLFFLAPPELQIKQDIIDHLTEHNVWFHLNSDPDEVLPHVDVVYQTRIDRERLERRDVAVSQYNINPAMLKKLKSNAIIMHPLPRSVEIDPAVDKDPRATYFRQSRNGIFVRMALLTMLFDTE
jgi:aspartate carbamoyltransferase catalytic subunit